MYTCSVDSGYGMHHESMVGHGTLSSFVCESVDMCVEIESKLVGLHGIALLFKKGQAVWGPVPAA